ncbi:hypothetical protein C6Y04_05970 [Bacillus sp. GBSW2]|uniref:hypothetical protein n=1 Tax=Bacillus sp. GBSW2 TaxID=2108541 RepID=UPI000D038D85|nr:hypothetical protein [Bacillus sp. GBSW2]PRS78132.1 hypothetical protein C6Y04_05970 [Bacillus sp. GBSW2]
MPQNLKPYTDYVDGIKKQLIDVKASLKGLEIDEAIEKYEKRKEEIRQVFIDTRKDDYVNYRETIQYRIIEAEHDTVFPGEPRHSSNDSDTFKGPDSMIYDSLVYGEITEIGDTSKDYNVLPGNVLVYVHVNARSRYRGEGKSHIKIQPSITWKFDENMVEIKSTQDWEKIVKEIK